MKSHEEFYKDMLAEADNARERAEKVIADVPRVGHETAIAELDNAVAATRLWETQINDRKEEIAKQKAEEIDQGTPVDLSYLFDYVGELQNWLMAECMKLKYEGGILPKKG